MENLNVSLLLFNRKMDGLVENILARNLGTPEFRAQHVRAVNLCRRVAEHDVDLASELFFTFIMLGIHFGLAALHPERS